MAARLEYLRTLTKKHCEHTRLASLSQFSFKSSTCLVFAQGALFKHCSLIARSDGASSMMKILLAERVEVCGLYTLNVNTLIVLR